MTNKTLKQIRMAAGAAVAFGVFGFLTKIAGVYTQPFDSESIVALVLGTLFGGIAGAVVAFGEARTDRRVYKDSYDSMESQNVKGYGPLAD